MRTLILHANKFSSKVEKTSTRPKGISPEKNVKPNRELEDCFVVLFCVEQGDTESTIKELYKELVLISKETKVNRFMISPFVHLSKKIAGPKLTKKLYEQLVSLFDTKKFTIETSHFGYHKSLLLDIKGYPGAFRYREFT